jgi:hypothetical protein
MVPLVLIAVLWVCLCDFALAPLRGQLEARLIDREQAKLGPGAKNVMAFVEASEASIRNHSAGDAQLYAQLAGFCRSASANSADPLGRLRLADKSLKLHITAARCEPLNADHAFGAAMDYLSLFRPDLARFQAERVCRLLPNDPWARAYLAEGFATLNRPEIAEDYLHDAEQIAAERGIAEAQNVIATVHRTLDLADQR